MDYSEYYNDFHRCNSQVLSKKIWSEDFYYFYFIPVLIFLAAIINVYSYNTPTTELVEFIGVAISLIAMVNLYKKMVGVK